MHMELLPLADENKQVSEFALQMAARVPRDPFQITDHAWCDFISDTAVFHA